MALRNEALVMPVFKLKVSVVTTVKEKTETVVRGCSVKKVFLKTSQNSQENTCARVAFLTELQATL